MHENQILLFGMPRSGTTYVYQCLQRCFPDRDVSVTHSIDTVRLRMHKDLLIVVRDFRDVMFSQWRSGSEVPQGKYQLVDISKREESYGVQDPKKMSMSDIHSSLTKVLNWCSTLDMVLKLFPNTPILRYESIFNKTDVLVNKMSWIFNEDLSQYKEIVAKTCSLKHNKGIANKLESFLEIDKESDIHGGHIFSGVPGTWERFIEDGGVELVNSRLQTYLERWEYV